MAQKWCATSNSKPAGFSTVTSTTSEQSVDGKSGVVCTLCSRFTLHKRRDVIKTAGSARPNSIILNRQGLWIRARVPNPPDCAAPGLRLNRRRDHVGKRPNTGRTATRASVGRRHLLNSFVHRLRTRPRLSRAKRHFVGSLHPSNVLRPEPLRRRDYRLRKGGTTCTWPAQWFLFSISTEKTVGPIGPAAGQSSRMVASTQCRRQPRAGDPNHQHFRPRTSVHPP